MSAAKHTPGPWRYAPTNAGHMIAGGTPGYLAEVRDCGSGDVEANARLIAAAPDLLAALAECITDDGAKCLAHSMSAATHLRARIAAINVIARAAIAKARGQS